MPSGCLCPCTTSATGCPLDRESYRRDPPTPDSCHPWVSSKYFDHTGNGTAHSRTPAGGLRTRTQSSPLCRAESRHSLRSDFGTSPSRLRCAGGHQAASRVSRRGSITTVTRMPDRRRGVKLPFREHRIRKVDGNRAIGRRFRRQAQGHEARLGLDQARFL